MVTVMFFYILNAKYRRLVSIFLSLATKRTWALKRYTKPSGDFQWTQIVWHRNEALGYALEMWADDMKSLDELGI